MKHLKYIALIILVIALFTFGVSAADVGNAFDDGDFGDIGGDIGGSDFDFGFFGFILGALINYPAFGVPFLIGLVIIGILSSKRNKKRRESAANTIGGIRAGTFNAGNMPEPRVISLIKEKDEGFSAEEFKAYTRDVYIKIQEAWEKRQAELLRPYESTALFETHRKQLQEYIQQKKTNHLDAQCVFGCTLTCFGDDGKNETLTVRLNATLLDFITDDETGNLLSGSKTERQNRFYRLVFVRTSGTKTDESYKARSNECPSCGAPVSVSASGICEYCGNVVTVGKYGWVLNEYTRWM